MLRPSAYARRGRSPLLLRQALFGEEGLAAVRRRDAGLRAGGGSRAVPHPRPHPGDRGRVPAVAPVGRAPEALARARAAGIAGGAAREPAAALRPFPGPAEDGAAVG